MSEFHDGYFMGIDLRQEGVAQLFLRDLDGHDFCLFLRDLKRLICDEFREGNIILDIQVFCGEEPPIDTLAWLYSVDSTDELPTYLLEQIGKIASGAMTLVLLSASYGGVLAAVCETCELDR